ncbi:choice-of-anchor Q domain-containing protein [Nostoc sp. UHCC 0302]|uniref:beta strand repeat-containing protein n=1 Tax=Nostoc sp. UHCC 0302 TaxID=3134896 RepID=UPI00311CB078
MAIFSVTNTNDIGKGSLRQAIREANALIGKDTINFDGVFTDSIADTITLGGSSLKITDDLSIEGRGANLLTVSGNNASRVFDIGSGITVEIDGLTIAKGYVPDVIEYNDEEEYNGGGIRNYGRLTINNSTISENQAKQGGSICNYGTLTVNKSTISYNTANYRGGGILNTDTLTVNNSTISSNRSDSGGGIYNTISGSITLSNSTISYNEAYYGSANDRTTLHNSGTLTVNNSTFSGNYSADAGNYGTTLHNSGTLTVNNSTFSGNSGTAIHNFDIATVNNSIIAGNLYFTYDSNTDGLIITNTDVKGNFLSNGHNLIGNFNGSTGFNASEQLNVDISEVLDTNFQNNGGSVNTYALVLGSPAINGGNNIDVPIDTTDLDSDGNTTEQIPFDGRGSGFNRISAGKVDIGAIEASFSIFTVTNINDSGSGSLRQAILDANAQAGQDIINFGGTVFADNIADTITLDSDLLITDDLSIDGTGADLLTLSGNNASRVFKITSGVNAVIEGLTIANGYNSDVGGGIYNSGNLKVRNSTISNNNSDSDGGGIFNDGSLKVRNSTISNNNSDSNGGGIYDGEVINSTITGNSAQGDGGGVYSGRVINSTITGNSARRDGGGIYDGEVINSTITGNSAQGDGGGIANVNSVISSTISSNSAVYGGGIANANSIINSTINGNSAQGDGGGIYQNTYGVYRLMLNNSTLSGNSAQSAGGGLYFKGGKYLELEVNNSTITGNSAQDGGGIYYEPYFSDAKVNNSIIAGNFDISNNDPTNPTYSDVAGNSFSSNGFNLIGVFTQSSGFKASEQLRVPITTVLDITLQNNGGSVKTHALVYGSPAINSGNNADLPYDYPGDLDGDFNDLDEQIPFDGRGVGFDRISGGQVDIGAFEAVENVINGTPTRNIINGTAANDIITGYQGRDVLSGGAGADAFVYTNIWDLGDTISDFEVARDKIALKQLFESLNLGNLNFASAISGGYLGFKTQGSDTIVLIDPDGSSGQSREIKFLTVNGLSATALNNAANFVFAPPTPSTSIFTVSNTNDNGSGSLRQAILDANASWGKDIIKFDGVFTDNIADTITLTSGSLFISEDLSIDGTGTNLLTISGNNTDRVFEINYDTTVDIEGLTIAGVNVSSSDFDEGNVSGGGIINFGTLTVSNSTIRDNSANYGGGVYNNGTLTLNSSTINSNSAYQGGGIYNSGILTVNNSTISANSAGQGSGIFNANTLTVTNSSITFNTGYTNFEDEFVAGIYNISYAVTVKNSIIAGNSYALFENPTKTFNFDVAGRFISNGYNLIGNISGSSGFNSSEQLGVPISEVLDTTLQDNGGKVKTHALLVGSPAINAGNNADVPQDTSDLDSDGNTTEPIPFDARGVGYQRISEGTVDIGAFEQQSINQID